MSTIITNYLTFNILETKVHIISDDDTAYGRNTVAEIDGQYHYLGSENNNITAAIFAYQDIKKCELTQEQLKQVFLENNIISQAV